MRRLHFPAAVFLAVAAVGSGGPSELTAQELPADQIEAAYHRSYAYERDQDFSNAIRALAPVYEAYPAAYTVNLRMGWLFYLNGNHANALAHYETAMAAAPFALEPRLGRLLPLLAQERWSEVESQAYQIVSVDHYSYYGNLRLSLALRMQGKTDAALQVATRMLTAYPTDVSYLIELAWIRDARGEGEEAARLFGEILVLDPENAQARAYLGR